MDNPPKRSRENRTITVDFKDETTYHQLCDDGPRFIDCVVAFILSIGLQLKHKCYVHLFGSPATPIMSVLGSTGL
jgi:hypothetical protein